MWAVVDLQPNVAPLQPPSQTFQPAGQNQQTTERLADHEKPAAKKRRVEDGPVDKEGLVKASVQLVSRAVEDLATDVYRVDEIAVQAVAMLVKNSPFLHSANFAQGTPALQSPKEASTLAFDVVNRLATLPQYQIQHRQPLSDPTSADVSRPYSARLAELPALVDHSPLSTFHDVAYDLPPKNNPGFLARYTQRLRRKHSQGTASAPPSSWQQLKRRPYLAADERALVAAGVKKLRAPAATELPIICHVDFTIDEVHQVFDRLQRLAPVDVPRTAESLKLISTSYDVASIVGDAVPGRTAADVRNYFKDLVAGHASHPDELQALSLNQDTHVGRRGRHGARVSALLFARELDGNVGFGRTRQLENFQNEFKKSHEDGLTMIAEFTNCAGDISAMSWVPDANVLCGTTAHSDIHNQQYNKPGNLLLCSTSEGTLRAFDHHRIPRPRVEKGENANEAMRLSQDPWLYASVVSSDFDDVHRRAFTSSFDRTVKVWKVAETGAEMECVASWQHGGNVNFVAAAKDGSGRVASAADVPTEAVRIYTINADDVAQSPYQAISCSRTDADGSDKWAYFPATMEWGRAPGTTHLLLVGYSPRALTSDDRDIPEDKVNSGEIMLWDSVSSCRVAVLTATTANVFEVAWHPELPRFIAATSPSGLTVEQGVRTQIHLFQLDRDREDVAYSEFQKLDCPAVDINELTFVPNSLLHAYVTAGCTDGNVYVWDTAQGDRPIHQLKHGYPLDDFSDDREREDTGVKFTAWGTSLDRFYSGSSDGVVKVWNVRNRSGPFVRNLLEAPGPISCGKFAPDHAKLAIGDASGRVFLFSVDQRDEHEAHFMTLPGTTRRIRRPTPYIPHAEPPPPPLRQITEQDPVPMELDTAELSTSADARRTYLSTGRLVLNPNPVIGAVKGPEYASTGLYRRSAYVDGDISCPLLSKYARNQRENLASVLGTSRRSERRLKCPFANEPPEARETREKQHSENKGLDLDGFRWESSEMFDLLVRDGAVLSDAEEDWGFEYDDMSVGLAGDDEEEVT
ncbi:hypothetical protein RJ55_03882 [Drechmeria coniospora]|nr:hypothetical protein RJ55_03882 [Drechmeria coniospora]